MDKAELVFVIFFVAILLLAGFRQFWRQRYLPELYNKLMVIRLRKAKKEWQENKTYQTLNADAYRSLGLSLFLMFVATVALFYAWCRLGCCFECSMGVLRLNSWWLGVFVAIVFILPFWLCGYFRSALSLLKNAKKMCKTDGFMGLWAAGGAYIMQLIMMPVLSLGFFCAFAFYFYTFHESNYHLAYQVVIWWKALVIFSVGGAILFLLLYLCSSPRNVVLKNNILTITTGLFRRNVKQHMFEEIEDIKFRCVFQRVHVRVNGMSVGSNRGSLYIKTTGESFYKAYSIRQCPSIGEIETLVYLIHMIKQRELDMLTEVTPEYVAALRRKYILSELDTIKTDRK